MQDNWSKVFESGQQYQVELIKGMLKEHDIEAVSLNKQDSSYHIGTFELYVKVEDAFKAKQIIEKSYRE
ncbi:MAG: putative signal transducing protein [Bacteroidota bacterium]